MNHLIRCKLTEDKTQVWIALAEIKFRQSESHGLANSSEKEKFSAVIEDTKTTHNVKRVAVRIEA